MMESTGHNRTFDTGAVRDSAEKKPMLQLISPHIHFRLGEWLRFACVDRKPEPYPPRNWEKGMPFSETIGSMERHLQKIKLGDTLEDHVAAIAFGTMALAHYEEEIKAGRMDPSIDDMPKYVDRPDWDTDDGRTGTSNRETAQYGMATPYPVVSTFYIAGPMRGYKNLNFFAFDAAKLRGERLGYNIISPADLDRKHGIDPSKDPAIVEHENVLSPAELREIVQRDIEVISSLRVERGDGIAVLNGWGNSTGATAEVTLARWLGLKVVWASDFCTPVEND